MVAIVRAESSFSRRDRAFIAQAQPRRKQLAGTRVHDFAALGKAILLCGSCQHKFHAARVGYVTRNNIPFARGQCDGCLEHTPKGRLFLKGDG